MSKSAPFNNENQVIYHTGTRPDKQLATLQQLTRGNVGHL